MGFIHDGTTPSPLVKHPPLVLQRGPALDVLLGRDEVLLRDRARDGRVLVLLCANRSKADVFGRGARYVDAQQSPPSKQGATLFSGSHQPSATYFGLAAAAQSYAIDSASYILGDAGAVPAAREGRAGFVGARRPVEPSRNPHRRRRGEA